MEPNPEAPLPAFRIMPLMNRTVGPSLPTGQYALVVNWDPKDPSFTLKDKSMKKGEHGKFVGSWRQVYTDAVLAILAIEEPLHRKALLRGLTPVPLQLLRATVVVRPCGEADFAGAAYQWQFLGDTSGNFNVDVDETRDFFQGIHDTR